MDLLMGEILAALQSVLAPLHGLNQAVLVVEITRDDILHKVIGLSPMLGRPPCEPLLQIGVEMYFHVPQHKGKRVSGQADCRRPRDLPFAAQSAYNMGLES